MDNKRYIAQLAVPEVGFGGQEKIRLTKIMIVGAGGLGCPVLQYLVGMGVGTIGITDHDTIHISNLHRQIIYTEADIGRSKAEIAAQRLKGLNSSVEIKPTCEKITLENVYDICTGYDIIVDCTDNYESRQVLDSFCHSTKTPLVFGAVQQFQGMVSVFNYKGDYRYADLFPEVNNNESLTCGQEGIMGYVAGYVGCLMVNEVVKIILSLDGVLSGKVLTIDLQEGKHRSIQFQMIR